jgi:hypothetical protein
VDIPWDCVRRKSHCTECLIQFPHAGMCSSHCKRDRSISDHLEYETSEKSVDNNLSLFYPHCMTLRVEIALIYHHTNRQTGAINKSYSSEERSPSQRLTGLKLMYSRISLPSHVLSNKAIPDTIISIRYEKRVFTSQKDRRLFEGAAHFNFPMRIDQPAEERYYGVTDYLCLHVLHPVLVFRCAFRAVDFVGISIGVVPKRW